MCQCNENIVSVNEVITVRSWRVLALNETEKCVTILIGNVTGNNRLGYPDVCTGFSWFGNRGHCRSFM